MIRLLLIVLFIASIVMSNQSMAVVDDTPVFVNGGTLAISSIPATSGTASVSVTNFPATQNVSVTGVVTTTGTQAIAGVVTTAGTVTVANPVTSVTVSNFPASQITTVTNGTITVSNPTTSVVVSSLPAIAGTVVVSSSALPSGASTSAKQDTLLATEGSIANAVVNGTLVVTLGSRFTSQTFAAASQGTLSLELGKGISEITIDSYDPDACTGSFCAYTDKKFYFYGSLDGVNFRPISCSDSILLDEQIPIDSISGDGTNNGTGYFRCPVSGIETFRMIAAVATKRAALSIAASSGNTMVQQVQAIGYTKQYDWPNGSATTANSKSIIPATDSINFPVMVNGGTIACSNCSGASSGTTAISGTVPVSVVGVVTTTGTVVQGAAGSSPWLTTSTLGTLTKVSTVDTITNAVTVNAHNISGGTLGVIQLATVTGTVNIAGTPTVNITGGTLGIAGVITTTGTLVQGAAGASAWLTTSLVGTTSASQLGTWTVQPGNTPNTTSWNVAVSGGTIGLVSTVGAGTLSVKLLDSANADLSAAKGSQPARFVGVQNATDSGRTAVNYYFDATASGSTGTETMITLTKSFGTLATSSGTSFVVTAGKTFRINDMWFASRGNVTATAQVTKCSLRFQRGVVGAASTPVLLAASTATPATALAWDRTINLVGGDGFEIAGDGTVQFGLSCAATFTTNAPTWYGAISGYEY
jgi:hypothetical protein